MGRYWCTRTVPMSSVTNSYQWQQLWWVTGFARACDFTAREDLQIALIIDSMRWETEQLTHRSLNFFILKLFSIKGVFLALILISPPEISKQKIQVFHCQECFSPGADLPACPSITSQVFVTCLAQFNLVAPGPLCSQCDFPAFVATGVWHIDLSVVWLLHQTLSPVRAEAGLFRFPCPPQSSQARAATAPLGAKAVTDCTLSQVYRKAR